MHFSALLSSKIGFLLWLSVALHQSETSIVSGISQSFWVFTFVFIKKYLKNKIYKFEKLKALNVRENLFCLL